MEYNVLSVSNGFISDVCLFPTCCMDVGCNGIHWVRSSFAKSKVLAKSLRLKA